jgi:hypothetical protein
VSTFAGSLAELAPSGSLVAVLVCVLVALFVNVLVAVGLSLVAVFVLVLGMAVFVTRVGMLV